MPLGTRYGRLTIDESQSSKHLTSQKVDIHPILQWYVYFLSRYRYLVLVVFLLLMCGLGALAMGFINNCTLEMNPPSGAESFRANDALAAEFPSKNPNAATVIVSIRQTDGKSVLRDSVQHFSRNLNASVFGPENEWATEVDGLVGYYTEVDLGVNGSYLHGQLVSNDEAMTIISITLRSLLWSDDAINFSKDFLQKWIDKNTVANLSIGITGVPSFIPLMTEIAMSDMEKADGIGLPIALLVMALILRSWRVAILPLIAMIFSISITFGIMYFVAQVVSTMQATAF